MTSHTDIAYQPDVAIPPGETIREAMEARGMNQSELSQRLEKSPAEITAILKGTQDVTPEVALRLESVMGIPTYFWLNLQAQYDETRARLDRQKKLKASEVRRFPYAEMAKLGWVPQTKKTAEKAEHLLAFFGVSSLRQVCDLYKAAYGLAYRMSAKRKPNPDHVAAWLRRGQTVAQGMDAPHFDKNRLRASIPELRSLTVRPAQEAGARLREICLECGVTVTFVPCLAKTHVNGATMWLRSEGSVGKEKPVILISLRGRYADIFWFTVFHEILHLFSERKGRVFIDVDDGELDEEESRADRFAAETLIPESAYRKLQKHSLLSASEVKRFARPIGIHPGIVVGRLHNDGIVPHKNLNGLRERYCLVDES